MPEVLVASDAERGTALAAVLLGFAGDPMMRWIWPAADDYLRHLPRFIEAFGGRAFAHRSAYVSADGRGAALWLPPGVTPDDAAIGALMFETVPAGRLEEVAGFGAKMAEFHPSDRHWYLPLLAVDPIAQGRGLGAALMKHALAVCDRDRLPAYLESSNPRNLSLYQRHGFEVIGEIQHGSSPLMTPMLRLPR